MGQTTFSNSKPVPLRFQTAVSGKNIPSAGSVPIANRNPFANLNFIAVDGYAKSKKPQFGAAVSSVEPRFLDDIGGNVTRWFSGITGGADGGFSLSPEAIKKSVSNNAPLAPILLGVGGLLAVLASGFIGHKVGSSKAGKVITKIEEKVIHSGGGSGGTRIIHTSDPPFSFADKPVNEIIDHLNSLSPERLQNILFRPDDSSLDTALHQALNSTDPAQAAAAVQAILEKLRRSEDATRHGSEDAILRRLLLEEGANGVKPIDLAASRPALIDALKNMLTELRSTTTDPTSTTVTPNHSAAVLTRALSSNYADRRRVYLDSDSALHHAARNNNPEGVTAIFNAVTDRGTIRKLLSPVRGTYQTPALLAIEANDLASFKAILAKHAEIGDLRRLGTDYGNPSLETLFHHAARSTNPEFIRELIALVNANNGELGDIANHLFVANNNGEIPAHLAAQNSALALQAILDAMATHGRFNEMLEARDGAGNTLFHTAALHNLDSFKHLITRFENSGLVAAMLNQANAAGKSVYGTVIENPDALKEFLGLDRIKNHSDRLLIYLGQPLLNTRPHIPFDTHGSTAFQASAKNPQSLQVMCDAIRAALLPGATPAPLTAPEVLGIFTARNGQNKNVLQMVAEQGPASVEILTNFLKELVPVTITRPELQELIFHPHLVTSPANPRPNAAANAFHIAAEQDPESLQHMLNLVQPDTETTITRTLQELLRLKDTLGENALLKSVKKGEASAQKILESLELPVHATNPDNTLRHDVLISQNTNGENALHLSPDVATFKLLLGKAQPNPAAALTPEMQALTTQRTTDNETILHRAVRIANNPEEAVNQIITHMQGNPAALNTLITAFNDNGENALHLTTNTAVVERILAHVQPDPALPLTAEMQALINQRTTDGQTVLHRLINNPDAVAALFGRLQGDPAALNRLITAFNGNGENALHLATNTAVVERILAQVQPDPTVPATTEMQALINQITAAGGQTVLHRLVANNPDAIPTLFTRLQGDRAALDRLLTTQETTNRRNPLYYAQTDNTVETLLNAAQPDSSPTAPLTNTLTTMIDQTDRNDSVLRMALRNNHSVTILPILNKIKGDPVELRKLLRIRDNSQQTVLQCLAEGDDVELLKNVLAIVKDHLPLAEQRYLLNQLRGGPDNTVLSYSLRAIDMAAAHNPALAEAILDSVKGDREFLQEQLLTTVFNRSNSFHLAIEGAHPETAIAMIKAAKTEPTPLSNPSILRRLMTARNGAMPSQTGLHTAAQNNPALFENMLKEFSGELTPDNLETNILADVLTTPKVTGIDTVFQTAVTRGQDSVEAILRQVQSIGREAFVNSTEAIRTDWPANPRNPAPADANAISTLSNSGVFRTSLDALTLTNEQKDLLTTVHEWAWLRRYRDDSRPVV